MKIESLRVTVIDNSLIRSGKLVLYEGEHTDSGDYYIVIHNDTNIVIPKGFKATHTHEDFYISIETDEDIAPGSNSRCPVSVRGTLSEQEPKIMKFKISSII